MQMSIFRQSSFSDDDCQMKFDDGLTNPFLNEYFQNNTESACGRGRAQSYPSFSEIKMSLEKNSKKIVRMNNVDTRIQYKQFRIEKQFRQNELKTSMIGTQSTQAKIPQVKQANIINNVTYVDLVRYPNLVTNLMTSVNL